MDDEFQRDQIVKMTIKDLSGKFISSFEGRVDE